MQPLARISRAHRQVGKPGAQIKVDRLHHDSLFLGDYRRRCRRVACLGYFSSLHIAVLIVARIWQGVGLFELHDPLANVGRQLAVPHALASGAAPQQADGLSADNGIAAFGGHDEKGRDDAEVCGEAGLDVVGVGCSVVAVVVLPASLRIGTAVRGCSLLVIADDFPSEADDLFEVREEVIELDFGLAEDGQKHDLGVHVEHLQSGDG